MSEHLYKLVALKLQEEKRRFPSVPIYAIPKPRYSDNTANSLTKSVKDFLNLSGHQAERVSNMGRVINKAQRYKNAVGQTCEIGGSEYIPGTGTKGTADIHSEIHININGRVMPVAVKWEVKIGKDRQSEAQKKYAQKVGYYFIITSFDDFYQKYITLLNELQQ